MENITIPMEEYKELLIIKGKYEELKSQTRILDWDKITKTSPNAVPYTLTCRGE